MNITVLGAGNYGTVLAKVLAEQNAHSVRIWNWEGDPAPLDTIESARENTAYLPGISLPSSLTVERDLEAAVRDVELMVLAIPSGACMSVAGRIAEFVSEKQTILVASKGFCRETNLPLVLAIREIVPETIKDNLTIISGPAIAKDLAAGEHTCMQVAGYETAHVAQVQSAFLDSPVYLCPSDDVIGLSIGGAFKNVYAIALGMCDGLEMSLNTKSAMLVFAMEELAHVSTVLGGKKETVYGLSGLGDLVGTGLSEHSRNRRFGEYLMQTCDIDQAKERVGQVVEGLEAVDIIRTLGNLHGTSFPFADVVHECLVSPEGAKARLHSFIDSCSIAV